MARISYHVKREENTSFSRNKACLSAFMLGLVTVLLLVKILVLVPISNDDVGVVRLLVTLYVWTVLYIHTIVYNTDFTGIIVLYIHNYIHALIIITIILPF